MREETIRRRLEAAKARAAAHDPAKYSSPTRAKQALSAMRNRERQLARMLAAVHAGRRPGEYVDFPGVGGGR